MVIIEIKNWLLLINVYSSIYIYIYIFIYILVSIVVGYGRN